MKNQLPITWRWYVALSCILTIVGYTRGMAQEETAVPGWMRVDTDGLKTQLWFGATHPLGSLKLASDIYVVDTLGEFDIGPSLTVVDAENTNLTLLPMAGIIFDFGADTKAATTLVAPQLFTYLTVKGIYLESWLQGFLASPFDDAGEDVFYTRDFLLYALSDTIAIGPQVEVSYRLNEPAAGLKKEVISLPVGGRINLAYGTNNTLGLFLGYETKSEARKDEAGNDLDGIVGRFTFIRTW